jgi:pyrroline-5-carboxylate reductase
VCVKPSDVIEALHGLRDHSALWPRTLIISIAAGISTSAIEQAVGAPLPVVRAMPNTPCLIGHGMTVVARGSHATDEHLATAHAVFGTLGRCIVLDEKHMDVVTGLSDGGVRCGLPRATATEMVAQVALGAASMVLSTGRHPSALKDDVTTPGGCTIAGLLALEDGKIRSVLARAVETATTTAASLGAPADTGRRGHAHAHVHAH